MRQHLTFELAQCRTRVEAELVCEQVPCALESTQAVGLSVAPVERDHQLAPEVLAQRMLENEAFELGRDSLVLASGQIGVDAVLGRGQSHLFESGPMWLGELLEREVFQRRAAPQRQGGAERDPGIDVSSGNEMIVALLGEGCETLRIDPLGIDLQDVTAVAGFDRCIDEQATEL